MAHYLKERYQEEIVPALMQSLNLDNLMEVPRLDKIVVNIGVGEALENAKALDAAVADLTTITGQKPIITKAKKINAPITIPTAISTKLPFMANSLNSLSIGLLLISDYG